MTSKRVRHKTGTANYASTGEDLAQSLFTPEMWVDNGVMSTSRRLPASVRNMTGSMESLPAIEEAVEKLKDGSIASYRYDPGTARIVAG